MQVCTSIAEVRDACVRLASELGFVPTMGSLHAGHMELVRRARAENAAVAASIFVNPTQFSATDDFQGYPRDLDRDLAMLEEAGVDLVFVPTVDVLYPDGFATVIDVGPVTIPFEGTARPGHFQGVATVVTMLFNVVQPARAYFGEKDAQQVRVIRRVVADLQMPVRIIAVPTVRDADGLALSSRNALLTTEQRAVAGCVPRALQAVTNAWSAGERDAAKLQRRLHDALLTDPAIQIEYASLADPETLAEHHGAIGGAAIVLVAVRLGNVRLIDNTLLPAPASVL